MKNRFVYSCFLILLVVTGRAQGPLDSREHIRECSHLLNSGYYVQARNCLEDLLPIQPNNVKVRVMLAEVYFYFGEIQLFKQNVEFAIRIDFEQAQAPLWKLAQRLATNGERNFAAYIMDKLVVNQTNETEKKKANIARQSILLRKQELSAPHYEVAMHNLGDSINSKESEYLPSLTLDGNTLVFTRRVGGMNEDFFISHKDSLGRWMYAKNMGYPPNTSSSDAAAQISADGNYLFFTRCDMRSINGYDAGGCDLVFCYKDFDEEGQQIWSSPQYFLATINSPGFEGQPCLSSNNRELFFVSNREGGYGGNDIYVTRFEKGLWSKPENLGPDINTAGDEASPFIHPDNETLYFSSNGHPGMGNMDLYISRRKPDRTWGKPMNLGSPLNSKDFDGSIIVSTKGNKGYLASVRPEGKGGLDLYEFNLYNAIRPKSTICYKGRVKDKKTDTLIKNVMMDFYVPDGAWYEENHSNKGDASFTQALHTGRKYILRIDPYGFRKFFREIDLGTDTFSANVTKDVYLKTPGLSDTLFTGVLSQDSNGTTLNAPGFRKLDSLLSRLPVWEEDQSDICFVFHTGYYMGEGEGDTSNVSNILKAQNRIRILYDYLSERGIDCGQVRDYMVPYLWREDEMKEEQVYVEVIESY